jgi:hypothetical protein
LTYLELLSGVLNIVDLTTNITSNTRVNIVSPWIDLSSWTGMVAPFAMGTPPAGWLACPTVQTLVSTTTYARLFAAIGYSWGGAGSSFGLPYFAAGYVPTAGTAGVITHGKVKDHIHGTGYTIQNAGAVGFIASGGVFVGSIQTVTGTPNSPEGGTDNLAAGYGVQYCVKY